MTKQFTAAILFICLLAAAGNGSTIGYWEFDDLPGTGLPSTTNSASTYAWRDNIANSFTTTAASGKGVYRLRRPGGTDVDGSPLDPTSLVFVGAYDSGWARYTAVIDSFSFSGTGGAATGFQGEERVRFELLEDAFPSTSARMVLQRIRNPADGSSQVFLSGEALSLDGSATNIPAVPIFNGSTSTTPLTLMLDVDFDADTYSVSYAFDDNPDTTIGAGTIATDRGLRYGRLTTFRKLDSSPTERIDIDSIRIEAVPESTTVSFTIFGILGGLDIFRRRRLKVC